MSKDKKVNPRWRITDELEARRRYGPEMEQCTECDAWHPKQYLCPACGHDNSHNDPSE